MSKKSSKKSSKGKDEKPSKKVAEVKAKKGKAPAPKAGKPKKAKKHEPKKALVVVEPELEALDDVEREALEEYRRTVAENRARREQESQPEAIEADGWQFNMETSTFSLQRDSHSIAELTLDEQSMGALLQGLNSAYIVPDDEPPSYQVRIPDVYDAPPVLSLIKGGVVIGALALDEDFNESVGPMLKARYPEKPQEPAWARFKAWVKAHKVRTVLLALLAIPVLVLLVEGAYTSLLASFS